MSEVAYGARTIEEALRQYHADALRRARTGWVPLTEDRRTEPALVVVEYAHRPSAAAEVVSVLEALAVRGPEPQPGSKFRRGLRALEARVGG